MIQMDEKVQKLLNLIQTKYHTDEEALKKQYEKRISELEKKYEKDIQTETIEIYLNEQETVRTIEKKGFRESEMFYNKEKLKLINTFIERLMAEIKEKIINSNFEKKRNIYLLLFNQALLLTKDVYTISCSKDDYELIKSFSEDKKILIDSTLSGSIVLDCGKYKIKSTIDMFLNQYTPMIYDFVIKWMEEYR
ncbi:MAG TPA: hypothetical protein PLU28_10100 [Petrotogaceae bacterium]|nr:hypothetical protein [Petrotogaceae bacterium]HOG35450.1 hypothetical protein [Petrotogaceae bacterium]HQC39864.1 hypothetical protein [Petrotogaceae bacterium]